MASKVPVSNAKVAVAAPAAVPVRWASCMTSKRRSAEWPVTSKLAVIEEPVAPPRNAMFRLARPLTASVRLRTLTEPVPPLKTSTPEPRLPETGAPPMVIVLAFRTLVPAPSLSVCTAVPLEMSPRPMRLALMVLAGDRIIVAVPPLVPLVSSPRRKMPAAPALTVKLASAVMSTVSVEALVPPVAPPTWNVAPLATRVPPSVKKTLETSVAETFAPRVLVAVVVRVRPVPMRTIAEEPAVFVPVARPPIVWSKDRTSSVAVGVAAVAVEALPSWIVAFGEKVFVPAPFTVPATTSTGPALTLVVLVKVSVPRPPLVTASLLAALRALLSAKATPKVVSPVVVTSVAEVPATRRVEVEAAELVTKPAPVRD